MAVEQRRWSGPPISTGISEEKLRPLWLLALGEFKINPKESHSYTVFNVLKDGRVSFASCDMPKDAIVTGIEPIQKADAADALAGRVWLHVVWVNDVTEDSWLYAKASRYVLFRIDCPVAKPSATSAGVESAVAGIDSVAAGVAGIAL